MIEFLRSYITITLRAFKANVAIFRYVALSAKINAILAFWRGKTVNTGVAVKITTPRGAIASKVATTVQRVIGIIAIWAEKTESTIIICYTILAEINTFFTPGTVYT